VVRRAAIALAVLAGACGSFEDPAIVLDLRILAMTAEPPEQVVPFDPANPLNVDLAPVEVCALIAEPDVERPLHWAMTACRPLSDRRCDEPDAPIVAMGNGTIDDPETAATPQRACATLPPGPELLAVLQDTIENDELSGFGGVDINVMIRVVPPGDDEATAVYGGKAVRFAPKIPEERVANANPTLDRIELDAGDGRLVPLALGRCVDQVDVMTVSPLQ
jgi:hypothetical protein